MIGPKLIEPDFRGIRIHITPAHPRLGLNHWDYEEVGCNMHGNGRELVRFAIAKVKSCERLLDILREVSIVQGDPDWNCVFWVRDALDAVWKDSRAAGVPTVGWETYRGAAMRYCQRKIDNHRFDGEGEFNMSDVPTYDVLQDKEIIT